MACSTARQKKFALKKKKGTGQSIASGISGDLSDSSIEEKEENEGKMFSLLSELSIDAFLGAIFDTEGDVSSLLACVNLSSLQSLNSERPRGKADALAKKVWQQIKYRFVYHSVYYSKQFPTARYMHHCSQMHERQHKPKKGRHDALNSAWNTNGSCFEVYALLGEVYGSGCPMDYILIQTSKEQEAGGKEHYLTELLSYFKMTWKIKAIIILTDKDISEINAFRKFTQKQSINFVFGIACVL